MTKQISRLFLAIFFLVSCQSEVGDLEKYYLDNIDMHKDVSDVLTSFAKFHQTNILLKRPNLPKKRVSFFILFKSDNTFYPVDFDSSFNRSDPKPDKTSKFEIPINAIREFDKSGYEIITSDSVQTVFSGGWDVKRKPGAKADSQYFLLISKSPDGLRECIKKISPIACLIKGVTP
ncbi:hypothetical protein ACX0G7_27255 [Flavitalea antarctica]